MGNGKKVNGVIYADNPEDLLEAIDEIRTAFAPYFSNSEVKPSRQGDYHVLFTIYRNHGGKKQ